LVFHGSGAAKNIRALAINQSGHIFAGTDGSGVYRSEDNGASWTFAPFSPGKVYSLAINSSGHIFAGTDLDGVYRSENDGDHWTQVFAPAYYNEEVRALAINQSGHVLAGAVGGVFRSEDNGDNWIRVQRSPGDVHALVISSSRYIFAGTRGYGVYGSEDNGDSWFEVNAALTHHDVYALAINSSGYIFAGTAGGVFLSIEPTN